MLVNFRPEHRQKVFKSDETFIPGHPCNRAWPPRCFEDCGEYDTLLTLVWVLGEPAAPTGTNCREAVRRAREARAPYEGEAMYEGTCARQSKKTGW